MQQAVRMRMHFVREHLLHGIVTGLEGVKTIATALDGLDRLIVSFKDAKVSFALMCTSILSVKNLFH